MPMDKHHTIVLKLVRTLCKARLHGILGAVSSPANVEPVLHGGIMNEQFLVFRAKIDITVVWLLPPLPPLLSEQLLTPTLANSQLRRPPLPPPLPKP